MSKKTRDYIFWVFSILFLIGTFFISLYASGYKINLSWPLTFNRLLLKTGMISIDTEPQGANIFLNNVAQKAVNLKPWKMDYLTTPNKIKNITPGEYELRIELSGYWPFTKRINVYSGQTTFTENINLFHSDLPILIEESPISELKINANGRYLYLAAKSEILNLKNDNIQQLTNVEQKYNFSFSNDDKLIIGGQIFTLNSSENINYEKLIGSSAKNWYYVEKEKSLYYQNNDTINSYNLSNGKNSTIISGGNYLAYQPVGQEIFLIENNRGKNRLKKYSLINQKFEQQIDLPLDGHYIFKNSENGYLNIYDDKNHSLYLINREDMTSGIKILNNVFDWQWIDDNKLFYCNNWEIYLIDLKNNNQSLITRLGEEIRKIIYNKKNNYLLYTSVSGLNAYDLQAGISTKIFTSENINSPVLDQKNSILYFWAKIGQKTGVYKLLLQ